MLTGTRMGLSTWLSHWLAPRYDHPIPRMLCPSHLCPPVSFPSSGSDQCTASAARDTTSRMAKNFPRLGVQPSSLCSSVRSHMTDTTNLYCHGRTYRCHNPRAILKLRPVQPAQSEPTSHHLQKAPFYGRYPVTLAELADPLAGKTKPWGA